VGFSLFWLNKVGKERRGKTLKLEAQNEREEII
jgi:hypothetical protein